VIDMAQINIKIDDDLKQDAVRTFSAMGLDLSTGIKLYLKRVTQDNKLPFTPKATSELDQAIAEADRGQVETFDDFDDWAASLDED
jgi:DNA-damage-inducible protein J